MKAGLFAICMLVPVIILVVALITKAIPNKEINSTFGYRSKKSMSSQENWDKAQELMSKYFLIIGIVLTVISIIAGLIIINRFEMPVMMVAVTVLVLIQVLATIVVIPLVESQLK